MASNSDVFTEVEPDIYEADEADRTPCCGITEGGWTWFGSILLTLTLFALFHLKYKKKVISRPKNLQKNKNANILKGYLLAQQKAARADMPEGYLTLEEFSKCCQQRRRYPVIFKIEYGTSVSGLIHDPSTQVVARSEENSCKNRKENIVPHDGNRVILKRGGEARRSDYINASHVKGLVTGMNYIVTQGPLDSTVTDFWDMVWQEKSPGIVMLTKTFDYIRVMSSHYWPSYSREETYGDIRIRLVEEENFACCVKRRLVLTREGETRTITHFQFTEWPCYSSPNSGALLHFQRMLDMEFRMSSLSGSPVVHCHDGGGRSGVFLMLDANIQLMRVSSQVNIFSYLRELREQRSGLVASQDHYKLVYSLLEEHLTLRFTARSVRDFLTDTVTDTRLAEEFDKVNQVRPELTQGDCAGAHREENQSKNRSILVLPPDKNRPYITSFQGNDCTDYINAAFVDGYYRLNEFIVTEWPLSDTIKNFWSMVWDHEAVTVVVLSNPRSSYKYPEFWPKFGKPHKYGPVFSLEQVAVEKEDTDLSKDVSAADIEHADLIDKTDTFTSVRLHICKKEVAPHRKTQSLYVDDKQSHKMSALTNLVSRVGVSLPPRRVHILQVNSGDPDPAVLAKMMRSARAWQTSEKPGGSPTIVVSSDGVTGAGVWCGASLAWDMATREGSVDTAHAVRSIRMSRPGLVTSLGEYTMTRQLVRRLVQS